MNDLEDRMLNLRARYVDRLAGDLEELTTALHGKPTAVDLAQVQRLSHRLAGISGTLGHSSISAAAIALDRDWTVSKADVQLARSLLEKLRLSCDDLLLSVGKEIWNSTNQGVGNS